MPHRHSIRKTHPTNRWTGAAVARFASSLVRRGLNEIAPPGQLKRSIALINDVNTRTVKRLLSFPIASVVCFGASSLVAEILLGLNHGFGAGDMYAFLYWTSLFAVVLLLPALAFALLLRRARTINRVWIGVLLGGLAGFGWTLLNLAMLGPWFGAWSFNVLYCWIVGGAAGILVVALFGQSQGLP